MDIELWQLLVFPKNYVSGLADAGVHIKLKDTVIELLNDLTLRKVITSMKACNRHTFSQSICYQLSLDGKKHQISMMKDYIFEYIQEYSEWNWIFRSFTNDCIKLVVMDLDSTLIQQEVIDEIAELVGLDIASEVRSITKISMQGQLPFESSLQARVTVLKGQKLDWRSLSERIKLTPGAHEFCACCKSLGIRTAICSGGFIPIVRIVQQWLDIDEGYANELEMIPNTDILTGNVIEPIFGPESKREALLEIAQKHDINELNSVMSIGDGANDIPMLQIAGVGIAFNAKQLVKQKAPISIDCDSMTALCLFLVPCSC